MLIYEIFGIIKEGCKEITNHNAKLIKIYKNRIKRTIKENSYEKELGIDTIGLSSPKKFESVYKD
jgi:hypothetical protein